MQIMNRENLYIKMNSFLERLEKDDLSLGDSFWINNWEFTVTNTDVKFSREYSAYKKILEHRERKRRGFESVCNVFWDNIKVLDYDGNHIEKGDIVYSGDSDDWDTRCEVLDIVVSIYDFSRYNVILITDYCSGPSKEFKLCEKRKNIK